MYCNKAKYSSEEYAMLDLAKIRRSSNRAVLPKRAYECTKCGKWHLTSMPDYKKLLDEILELKTKIKELESKKEPKLTPEEKSAIRTDKRVQYLTDQVKNLKEKLKVLKVQRKTIEELIIKNLQK